MSQIKSFETLISRVSLMYILQISSDDECIIINYMMEYICIYEPKAQYNNQSTGMLVSDCQNHFGLLSAQGAILGTEMCIFIENSSRNDTRAAKMICLGIKLRD